MNELANAKGDIYILVMDRDRRLTGWLRGQTDKVEAPVGFEVNNPWKVSVSSVCIGSCGNVGDGEFVLTIGGRFFLAGEKVFLSRGGFISYSLLCTITRRIHVQMRCDRQSSSLRLEYLVSPFLGDRCRNNFSARRVFHFRYYIFRLFPPIWPQFAA